MGPAKTLRSVHEYCFCNFFGMRQDVMVPEPDHRPALRFKIARPDRVLRIVEMLLAVDFDNQLGAAVCQIGDIGTDDQLPGKARTVSRQNLPQLVFRQRRVVAQRSRIAGHRRRDAAGHRRSYKAFAQSRLPTPCPSLAGRGALLAIPSLTSFMCVPLPEREGLGVGRRLGANFLQNAAWPDRLLCAEYAP